MYIGIDQFVVSLINFGQIVVEIVVQQFRYLCGQIVVFVVVYWLFVGIVQLGQQVDLIEGLQCQRCYYIQWYGSQVVIKQYCFWFVFLFEIQFVEVGILCWIQLQMFWCYKLVVVVGVVNYVVGFQLCQVFMYCNLCCVEQCVQFVFGRQFVVVFEGVVLNMCLQLCFNYQVLWYFVRG